MDRRIERPRRSRLQLWIGAAAIAAVVIAAAVFLLPPPGSLSIKVADTQSAVVQQAPFQDYLPIRAEVAPLHTVFIGAVSGGQVAQVIAQDGAEVAVGAQLATLSNPSLKLDVTSREAEISGRIGDVSAQSLGLERNRLDREKEIAETTYNLLKAKRDLGIRQQLHDQGFVSDAGVKIFADEADFYQDRLKTLKTGRVHEDAIAATQASEISQTKRQLGGSLSAVQASLDALVIRAPVAGRLTDFILQPGQTLKAGDQIGQIDSEGAYKLTADVDEFYLGRITPGQAATADMDGRIVPLTVLRVLPQVANGRFRAELAFKGAPPAGLRRGQTMDVRVTLGDTRPALVVSNGSWLEGGSGGAAFVLTSGGHRADRRTITIGRRNPEQVEITGGLHAGERVVTSSYAGFDKYSHLILH